MEKQQNNLREEELEKMDLLAIVDDIGAVSNDFGCCALLSLQPARLCRRLLSLLRSHRRMKRILPSSSTARRHTATTPHTPIIITRPVPAS